MDLTHWLGVVGGSGGLLTALGGAVQLVRTWLRNRGKQIDARVAKEVAVLEHDALVGPMLKQLLDKRDQRITAIEGKQEATALALEECTEGHAEAKRAAEDCEGRYTTLEERLKHERELLQQALDKLSGDNEALRSELKAQMRVIETKQNRLKVRVAEAGIEVDDTGQIHLDEIEIESKR